MTVASDQAGEREKPARHGAETVRHAPDARAVVVGQVGQHVRDVSGDAEQSAGGEHPGRGEPRRQSPSVAIAGSSPKLMANGTKEITVILRPRL